MSDGFSKEQQTYLQGYALGSDVARKVRGLPVISSSGGEGESITVGGAPAPAALATDPMEIHAAAQAAQEAAGGKLVAEEKAKRGKWPHELWDEVRGRADAGEFPKGTDVFLTKFWGMFYVAPAQDSYMCRMRLPGGALRSWQLRGLADLADQSAGGFVDITTRANLQYREIPAAEPMNILIGLRDLGIINFGSGADSVRNVTASPLSGLDPAELIETLPLARQQHHYLLNHRECHGLPRKFNIAFDGGGAISALEDTNDIGFTAVRVRGDDSEGKPLGEGVYFQLTLGGITGHKDFARPTGVLLEPHECVDVSGAILRVFIKNGDRTNRNKARLKYVLDDWGFDKFVGEVEKELGRPLRRAPLDAALPRASDDRTAHVGAHPQKQPGLNYLGVVFPVGRIQSDQMRGLAGVAERFGDGDLRLTVWQNLLIANIPDESLDAAKAAVEELGLDWRATNVRAGLVACTGSAGCKYAAAPTKANAMAIADYVDERLELDTPVNIHVTGCHHSCAQHYIGDIGLISANVEDPQDPDGDTVEGYHLFVGGGYGVRQSIARELFTGLPFRDVPQRVAALLQAYLDGRESAEESFIDFSRKIETEALRDMCRSAPVTV
ncbi:MAG: NirA family protein [Planctomycetota bacterium]